MADSVDNTGARVPAAVLTALSNQLRAQYKTIRNPDARRTFKCMLAAADVIEHVLAGLPQNQAAAAAMVSYVGRAGFAAYVGGAR